MWIKTLVFKLWTVEFWGDLDWQLIVMIMYVDCIEVVGDFNSHLERQLQMQIANEILQSFYTDQAGAEKHQIFR